MPGGNRRSSPGNLLHGTGFGTSSHGYPDCLRTSFFERTSAPGKSLFLLVCKDGLGDLPSGPGMTRFSICTTDSRVLSGATVVCFTLSRSSARSTSGLSWGAPRFHQETGLFHKCLETRIEWHALYSLFLYRQDQSPDQEMPRALAT